MNLGLAIRTVRQLGAANVARRAYHAFRLRAGLIERIDPADAFGPADLTARLRPGETIGAMLKRRWQGHIPFFFQGGQLAAFRPHLERMIAPVARDALLADAAAVADGRVRFFSRWTADLGSPIDWHLDPVTGRRWPADRHWRHYGQFDPSLGDIKMVWEASRFTHAFLLTRAYALTGDARHLRLGLRLIDQWIEANPPALGVQWNCGQETTFRLMGWLFLLHAAYGADVVDDDAFARIAASIYRQALRIERHIGFAVALNNNHSISEAMGLYTIGQLFPEFDRAERWRDRGLRLFAAEICRQVFADGSFIQHSTNYHRLMLHDALWTLRLAQLHGDRVPNDVIDRIHRALDWLCQLSDETSGGAPNYGQNDGALILPLDSCGYEDYRPALQAVSFLLGRTRSLDHGPWDEPLLWMFGPDALAAPLEPVRRASARFDAGGYYTLRGRDSWAMIRCHSYATRPGQADMLHLDLWWRGVNILRDSGTYSYNCPPPWDRFFKSTAAHNTVEVDGLDQMTKGPRFMWYDWPRSRLLRFEPAAPPGGTRAAPSFQGEHDGYLRRCGVVHRRTVEHPADDQWIVIDELLGGGVHRAALVWQFIDAPWSWDPATSALRVDAAPGPVAMFLEPPTGCKISGLVMRGLDEAGRVRGWESLYYGEMRPRPALCIEVTGQCPMRIVTRISLGQPA